MAVLRALLRKLLVVRIIVRIVVNLLGGCIPTQLEHSLVTETPEVLEMGRGTLRFAR